MSVGYFRLAISGSILILLCGTLSCANLPEIDENRCGNGVVEPKAGEQCDSYAPKGQFCRKAGAEEGACQFDCRVRATTETETVYNQCPADYPACGNDGLCHGGSGNYVPWGNGITASATRLLVGDLDGDKRDDIVTLGRTDRMWQALPTLFFLDKNGEPIGSFAPEMRVATPQITPLGSIDNNNITRKFLFSTYQGISSLSTSEDRVVTSDSYPYQSLPSGSAYRIVPISGNTGNTLDVGIVLFLGNETDIHVFTADNNTHITKLTKPISSIVGELLTANLDSRPSSPCSEFVFAFEDESAVYSIDPCDGLGQWKAWDGAPKTVVTLPKDKNVTENLLSSDVNGDGRLDLIVGHREELPGTAKSYVEVYVAFGLGDGRFVGNTEQPETTLGQALPLKFNLREQTLEDKLPFYPLALGDLNADGKNDWVLQFGIFLIDSLSMDESGQSVTLNAHVGNVPPVSSWGLAQIGDFNGDKLDDLVATTSDEPDIDFFLGTGQELMNPSTVATEGVVTHFTMGKYDGDGISDLAFAVKSPTVPDETVRIAFGSNSSPLTFTTSVGAFSDIKQLATGYYGTNIDAISELGVVSKPDDPSRGEELSVFMGNMGRHPISSLGLSIIPFDGNDYWGDALAVVAGRFTDSEARGAIVLAGTCDSDPCPPIPQYRLWHAAGNADTGLSNPLASPVLPNEFAPYDENEQRFRFDFIAGNLDKVDKDRDEQDELLLLATNDEEPNLVSLWPVILYPGVFSEAPDRPQTVERSLLGKRTQIAGTLLPTSNPTLIDLNRDDYADLTFIVSREGEKNALLVAWNNQGNLSLKDVTTVDLGDESPLGIYGRTDANGLARLLAVTTEHVYEIRPAKEGAKELTVDVIDNVPGGKAVALGDLTGDGLLDLVIADQGTLRFFAEKVTQP